MVQMELTERAKSKNKTRIIIAVSLITVLILGLFIGYLLLSDSRISFIIKELKSADEYTLPLEEFVVNLHSENGLSKNYLKVEIALMYKVKKHEKVINANINKIRDVIINDFMKKSAHDILDANNIPKIKDEIMRNINDELPEDIVKDVYFTNLVIQ